MLSILELDLSKKLAFFSRLQCLFFQFGGGESCAVLCIHVRLISPADGSAVRSIRGVTHTVDEAFFVQC